MKVFSQYEYSKNPALYTPDTGTRYELFVNDAGSNEMVKIFRSNTINEALSEAALYQNHAVEIYDTEIDEYVYERDDRPFGERPITEVHEDENYIYVPDTMVTNELLASHQIELGLLGNSQNIPTGAYYKMRDGNRPELIKQLYPMRAFRIPKR